MSANDDPLTAALPLPVGDARVSCGTCSWADRSLVKEADWYPKRTMRAAQRLAFYASRFPVVLVDSTYRFPPTPDVARQWVERTPDGFTMDVVAWSLLTHNATLPDSLWPDLQDEVRPEARDRRRLYADHLTADARREAWRRFGHALEPLRGAGRLGCVVLRYPYWMRPGETARAAIVEARQALSGLRLAVELPNHLWVEDDQCEPTLAFLEDHDLAFVCTDGPPQAEGRPPVVASTSDLAVVRLEGRNPGDWDDADMEMAQRFAYRYRLVELEEWVPRIADLAASTPEVHVLLANCWRDDAVRNAAELEALLRGPAPPPK